MLERTNVVEEIFTSYPTKRKVAEKLDHCGGENDVSEETYFFLLINNMCV